MTPFEILIKAKKDTAAIPQTTSELKELKNAADTTNKSFDEVGTRSENYGRMLSRGVQIASSSLDILAPTIGKIAPEFDAATRAAQQFGGAMSLAFSFGVPGLILAGITTAVGLIIAKVAEVQAAAKAAEEAVRKPFEDLQKTLDGMAPAVDKFAAQIQAALGVTAQTAAVMADAARGSEEYRQALVRLTAATEAQARAELERQRLMVQAAGPEVTTMSEMWGPVTTGGEQAIAAIQELNVTMLETGRGVNVLRASMTEYINTINQTVAAEGVWLNQNNQIAASMRQIQTEVNAAAAAQAAFNAMLAGQAMAVGGAVARQFQTEWEGAVKYGQNQMRETGQEWIAANKRAADEYAARVQRVIDTVKAMVERALVPTAVTAEDMAATRAGRYVTKWDEFARRAEAVAKGTQPSEYGAEFEKQLAGLGMTAEQAAQGFRDFSLFADPKNLNLADWGPIVADVQHQIDMLIGKANLAKEAFDQVWESLSPGKKAQLAGALGVDPTDANNAQKVFEAMSGGEAEKSAKTTSEIAANIQIISGIHTAIIDVQKSGTFDDNLKEILRDLAKIPNGYDVVVTITYASGGGTATPPMGTEVPPPTGPGFIEQAGGYGIARGYQWFRADPGEGWWFSGRNWQVPPPSVKPSGGEPTYYFHNINVYPSDFADFIRMVRALDAHNI